MSRLADTVRFYRGLGFFESYPSDIRDDVTALASFIDKAFGDKYGRDIEAKQEIDVWLMLMDSSRAMSYAIDDIHQGNNGYVDLIGRSASITRGRFAPEDAVEVWMGEQGPIVVQFDAFGQTHVLEVDRGRHVDTHLFRSLNEILKPTSLRFLEPRNHDGILVALTLEEEEQLAGRGVDLRFPGSASRINEIMTEFISRFETRTPHPREAAAAAADMLAQLAEEATSDRAATLATADILRRVGAIHASDQQHENALMWFGQAEEVLERSFRFSDGFRYLDSQQEALSIELELGRALAFHGLGDLQAAREAASNAERLVSKMPIDDLQRDQVLARVRELASIVGLKIRST